MSYKNFKPEEVIDILTEFQEYLTGEKEFKCNTLDLLGAVEYAKETVKILRLWWMCAFI